MATIKKISKPYYSLTKKVQGTKPKYQQITFLDKLLLTTLAVLLMLLLIQIVMLMLGLNKAHASSPMKQTIEVTSTPVTGRITEQTAAVRNLVIHEQRLPDAGTLTRAQIQQNKNSAYEQNTKLLEQTTGQVMHKTDYHQFSIYSADTYLYEDVDEDGYYRAFSVSFDADVHSSNYNEAVNVYAELYLSKAGGPWQHFYSSDIFTIVGDSSNDGYEVLTTLYEWHDSDYYDVLIDLYEVGYPEVVATYSGYDTDTLYGLPLESVDYDQPYYDTYVEYDEHHHGASMSKTWLLALILLLLMRAMHNKNSSINNKQNSKVIRN